MRILFLSRWFPFPYDNGAKIRIYNLIRGLARYHTVDLVTFTEEQITDQRFSAVKRLCNAIVTIHYRPFKPDSMKAITGFFSGKPRSVIDTYQDEFSKAVHQAVSNNQYDVLIASEIDMAIYGLSVQGPVKILEELEVTKALRPFQDESRWLRKLRYAATWWKLSRYIQALLKNYDGSTVVSEEERKALNGIASSSTKIGIIPNGVDISQFQPATIADIEADSLIYNGAITYPVNFEAVAFFINKIFPHILAERPNAHLYVTGKTTPELIQRMPAHPQVIYTGYLPDIRSVLMKCAVCVVPLLTGGGTRLKILESLASGIPVVSTSIGAEGLALMDGTDVLIADNPQHFAKCVVEILNMETLREKLRINGRCTVEKHYDWQMICDQFEEYMQEILITKRSLEIG